MEGSLVVDTGSANGGDAVIPVMPPPSTGTPLRRVNIRKAVAHITTTHRVQTSAAGNSTLQRNLHGNNDHLVYVSEAESVEGGEEGDSPTRAKRHKTKGWWRKSRNAARVTPTKPGRASRAWSSRRSPLKTSDAVVAQASGVGRGGSSVYTVLDELLAIVKTAMATETFDETELLEALRKHAHTIMSSRGTVGETVLHLCFLFGTDAHKVLASHLVQEFGVELVDAEYEGDDFHGEVAMHIALVNKDLEAVRFLVDMGADVVHPRADGNFFKRSEVYFGEYCISFAACLNLPEMVELFVTKGADVNAQDSKGNTALHMLVLERRLLNSDCACEEPVQAGMYKLLLRLGAQQTVLNKKKLTPLTMAAQQGRMDMFEFVLAQQRIVLWSYGPVTSAWYPLAEVETAGGEQGPHGNRYLAPAASLESDGLSSKAPSALGLIVDRRHVQCLAVPVVKQLIEDKWLGFVRMNVLLWFAWHLFTWLCMMTHIIFSTVPEHLIDAWGVDLKYVEPLYWVTCLASIPTTVIQMTQLRSESVLEYFFGERSLDNVTSFLFMACLWISVPLYLSNAGGDWANVFIGWAALFGSFYFIHFWRVMEHTGHLVVILERMMFDVGSWMILFATILLGFMAVFTVLYSLPLHSQYTNWEPAADASNASDDASARRMLKKANKQVTTSSAITNFDTVDEALLSLWRLTLGDVDYQVLADPAINKALVATMWFFFTLLVSVIMLNLLIAMMANTFQKIADQQKAEWEMQRAHFTLEAERMFSFFPRKRPSTHILMEGKWMLLKEDTTSSKYEYFSPPVKPDPNGQCFHLLSGRKPERKLMRRKSVVRQTKFKTTQRLHPQVPVEVDDDDVETVQVPP